MHHPIRHLATRPIAPFQVFDRLRSLASAWQERRRLNRDVARLEGMSAHMLGDIGVTIPPDWPPEARHAALALAIRHPL